MPREHLLTKYRLDPAAPTISWTTNFSTADQNVDQLEHEWSAYNLRVGLLKDVASFVDAERKTRKEIADCVSRWAIEHQETNVIIRPHPTEIREFYTGLYNELRRRGRHKVAMVINEPIWDVLEATDILLQRCCKTGLEAWLMGLPTFEMRLHPGDLLINQERDPGSEIVTSYAEFEKAMHYYLMGGKIPETQQKAREAYLARWFYRVDGRRTLACAAAIWKLLQSSANSRMRLENGERWIATAVWLGKRLEASLGLNVIRDYFARENWRRGDTYFTSREVCRWSDRIDQSGILLEYVEKL